MITTKKDFGDDFVYQVFLKEKLKDLVKLPGYISKIAEKRKAQYTTDDFKWFVWLFDHINYLKQNSLIIKLSNTIKEKYKNDFKRYLIDTAENDGIYVQYWMYNIYQLLNQVTSLDDIFYKDDIYLFKIDVINRLYEQYITYISNIQNAEKLK